MLDVKSGVPRMAHSWLRYTYPNVKIGTFLWEFISFYKQIQKTL